MKNVLLAAATLFMTGALTMADEKDTKRHEKKEDRKKVRVDVRSSGAAVVVDDNGNVEVKKFGEVDEERILKDLPEEIREKVKKAMKDGKVGGAAPFSFRGIFIGPDGKKHEFGHGDFKFDRKKMFEGLPEAVREKIEKAMKEHGEWEKFKDAFEGKEARRLQFKGRAVIIGPDGEKKEFEFGKPGDFDLKKHLDHLPDAMREKIEKAMRDHKERADRVRTAIRMGKAIIIGPDGKRREIDLGDGAEFDVEGMFKDMPKEVQDAIEKAMKQGIRWRPSELKEERRDAVTNKQILEKLESLQKQIDELREQLEEK